MPVIPPNLFGRFGTARQLESQVVHARNLQAAMKGARKEIANTLGKEMVKSGATAKKTHAEIQSALDMVSKRLKNTTKDANEYGKALKKDTKAVMEFSQRHNLSLQDAMKMYDKIQERQSKFWGNVMDKARSWASIGATIAAGTKVYKTRLEEVKKGHDLFLSSTALTGPTAKKAWGDTQTYIDGYREASRAARDMTIKYGVSVDEARQTTDALAGVLRGADVDAKDFGKAVKSDTDRLYGFSKMMGVSATDALQMFRDEMRRQGKTHEEAVKSLDITISGFDRMAGVVHKASRPMKEEYLKTLQDIQAQYGPTQVSTTAMTAAMNLLAEAAGKAGLSAEGVKDAMGLMPKLGQNLSRYHQIQMGRMIRLNDEMVAKLPEGIRKQIKVIQQDKNLLPFQKDEIIQQLTAGTEVGVRAMFDLIRKGSVVEQQMLMKGMSAQQKVAFMALKKMKVGSKEFDDAVKKLASGTKDVKKVRETLPQKLEKNTRGLDAVALKAFKLEETTKKLLEQYQELTVPALGALTVALNAGKWYRAIGNLSQSMGGLGGGALGAAGKLGKFAGKIGVAGAALTLWYMALQKGAEKLDEWQTKRLKREQKQRSITREVSAAHRAKTYEERIGAIRGMLSTSKTEGVLTKEGKINYAFLRKQAAAAINTGQGAKIDALARSKQVEVWANKLKEVIGEKGEWFGKGKELKTAIMRRDRDITLMKENERRRKEGQALLTLKKGETVKQAIAREARKKDPALVRQKQEADKAKEEKARAKVAAPTAPAGRVTVTGGQVAPKEAAAGGAPGGPGDVTKAPSAEEVLAQQNFDPATGNWTLVTTTKQVISTRDPSAQAAGGELAKSAMQKRGR